jgi:hypothetical protein
MHVAALLKLVKKDPETSFWLEWSDKESQCDFL